MPNFPNQRTVDNTVKEPCDKNHYYTTNNLDALQEAMMVLGGVPFKLWMYFAKNKAGHRLEITTADLARWGISESGYHTAWHKLRKLGYLEEVSNNHYIFHERAKSVPTIVDIDKEEIEFDM